MKFHNLGKFIIKYECNKSLVRINCLKQGMVIIDPQNTVNNMYLDNMRHGICYSLFDDHMMWCTIVHNYNKGNLQYKIMYDNATDGIILYEHYLNNQLHGKIFMRRNYRYLCYDTDYCYFINYKYGEQEGYDSQYKYDNDKLKLQNRSLYSGGINMSCA